MPIDCEGHLSEPLQSQLLGFHEGQKETGRQTACMRIYCQLTKPKSYLRLINCEIKTHFNFASVFGHTTDKIERLKALLGKRIFLPSFTIILVFLWTEHGFIFNTVMLGEDIRFNLSKWPMKLLTFSMYKRSLCVTVTSHKYWAACKTNKKGVVQRTYLDIAQYPPFQPACIITQNPESCICVTAEYKFVKYFHLLLTRVYNLLSTVGPVSRSTPNLDSFAPPSDLSDLALSNDSDRTLALILDYSFPNRIKTWQARKCAHTRYGCQKGVRRILELSLKWIVRSKDPWGEFWTCYQTHIRIHENTLENSTGYIRCLIASSKKEGNEGVDDEITKFLALCQPIGNRSKKRSNFREPKHFQHCTDRYQSENRLKSLNDLEDTTKLPDVVAKPVYIFYSGLNLKNARWALLINYLAWKYIAPKLCIWVTPKAHLHADIRSFEPQPVEKCICIIKHRACALHSVIDVVCAVFIFVYGSRCRHPACIGRALVECHVEFIGMLRESKGGGHSAGSSANNQNAGFGWHYGSESRCIERTWSSWMSGHNYVDKHNLRSHYVIDLLCSKLTAYTVIFILILQEFDLSRK